MSIVYALLDASQPGIYQTPYFTLLYKPYYIGKGYNESRPKSHYSESLSKMSTSGRRSYKHNKIIDLFKRNVPYEYIMFECVDEDDAFIKEMELIKIFGRSSDGGILTNVNPGGLSGTKKGHVHCHDETGQTVYVRTDDKRIQDGSFKIVGFGSRSVMCIDENGSIYSVKSEDYDSNIHVNMHTGRKRSEETKRAISEGKLKYTFTEDHIKNITEANRKISKEVHLGAKRKESTKKAISKSRYGSKSKVANTWRLTSPNGYVITYKGGIKLAEDLFEINGNRLIRFEGESVPYPEYTGHKGPRIYNSIGWKLEKNPVDAVINFEFIFS